jgi:hypothetical protein
MSADPVVRSPQLSEMPPSIRLTSRALTAFDQLASDEQAAVAAALSRLERQGPAAQGSALARVPDEADLYLLRVAPEVRAILRLAPRRPIEVLEIVRPAFLHLFRPAGARDGQ